MGRVLDASWEIRAQLDTAANHRFHYESIFLPRRGRQLLRVCDAYFKVTKDERLNKARAEREAASLHDRADPHRGGRFADHVVDGPEVVKDGLWSATQVLAIEAEAEWPDFQAARKAQDELAFLGPLLERLDSRHSGRRVLMARPVTGAVIPTPTSRGLSYALRFTAYGKRGSSRSAPTPTADP